MNRLIGQREFDGQLTTYTYAKGGLLIQSESQGRVSTYQYDAMRRLVQVRHQAPRPEGGGGEIPEPEIAQFAYDRLGRPIQAKNDASQIHWQYDPVGNLLEERTRYLLAKNWEAIWRHQYDDLNNRTATIRPDGRLQQWLTYGSGHVHGRLVDGIEMLGFERDDLHRETVRHLANHLQQQKSYDDAGRLAGLRVAPFETSPMIQSQELAHIARTYAYDPIGQLETITDNQRNPITYQHDPIGRLIAASGTLSADFKECFKFDPASNLLERDELVREQFIDKIEEKWVKPPEDAWGNTQEINTATCKSRLIWDNNNRLRQIQRKVGNQFLRVRYWYDVLGLRIAKHADVAADGQFREKKYDLTLFGWDGDTLAFEYNV